MKKTLIYILIIFFITGCKNENNSDYTLEIFPDRITETINLKLNDGNYEYANYLNDIFSISNITNNDKITKGKDVINKLKDNNLKATTINNNFFNKQINKNKITLSYDHEDNEYKNSIVFNSCFSKTYYDSTDNYYVIKGYDQFKCLYKDKIEVIIKTDHKVIDSNANKVKNNEYIWYFNEENYMNQDLYIQVSKTKLNEKNSFWKLYLIITIVIIYIIYKLFDNVILRLLNKNNEI